MKKLFIVILVSFLTLNLFSQHDLPFGGRIGDTNAVWVDSIYISNDSLVFHTSDGEYKLESFSLISFIEYGYNLGQEDWTITAIERDIDSLFIEVNDTMRYRITGSNILAFTSKGSVVSSDPLIKAYGGISVFYPDTKVRYIREDVDTLKLNVNGWLFKIFKQ